MELRRPQLADKTAVLDLMAEFQAEESPHAGGFWDSQNFDYQAWLERNKETELGLSLPYKWVPAIQFVAFSDEGQALGFLSLRLRLNEALLRVGGHIGYSVRPSQRGKGYAKEMLTEALQVCQAKNIKRALVTCHSDNPASRAVILANGGLLGNILDGVERYWIEVGRDKDE